ncbi:MAG: hypothetical protein QXH27_05270 [Candidatus Micrarchaeia archaeon]
MKKFFALFALAVLAPLAAAQEDDASAELTEKLGSLNASAENVLVQMDAVIGFMQANNIGGSEGLQAARGNFIAALARAGQAASQGDEEAFEAALEEAREAARAFRNTTANLSRGRERSLREKVEERVRNASQRLAALNNTAWAHAKAGALIAFDRHARNAEAFLNRTAERLAAQNISDLTEASATLDEIRAIRPQLEAAFDSGDREAVRKLQEEIRGKFKEFRQETIAAASELARKVFGRARERIAELENRGVNVSGVSEKLAAVEQIVQIAKSECGPGGNRSACRQRLSEAVETLKQARKGVKEARERAGEGEDGEVGNATLNETEDESAEVEDETDNESKDANKTGKGERANVTGAGRGVERNEHERASESEEED